MINKIFLKLFSAFVTGQAKLKLRYYKHLWIKQLKYDDSFIFDRLSSLLIQSGLVKVVFGKGVHFRKYCSIICSNNGQLTLGENVFFNNYCSINCLYKITIGENTIFGEGVKLYDHNHQFKNKNINIADQGYSYGEINIGSNCWIGSNVTILKGVTIGDNVVIGANCLIYKSVPANTIVKNKTELIFDTI